MTTFSHPVNIKRRETFGDDVINTTQARVPAHYSVPVNIAKTGTAAGVTTIPLFVAPAGATIFQCVIDVLTGYDNTTTNIAVGKAGATDIIHTAVTANTAGRRTYSPTAAQISVNAIPLAADTTVQALVSIDTSAVTTGSLIVHVVIV